MLKRGPYGQILAVAGIRRLYLASMAARVPQTVNALALVLFVEHLTGSIGTAGAAAGLYTFAWGGSLPFQARLVDRLGPRRVLPWLAVYQAASMLVLIVVALATTSEPLLLGLSFAAGLGQAPWSDVMRSLWTELLPSALVPSAFALDAALYELIWIVGPLLTGVLTALLSPQVALVGSSLCALLGSAAFTSSPVLHGWVSQHREDPHPLGALRSPGVRTVALAIFPIGVACGAIEMAVAAFAKDAGEIGATGALIAAWSASSAVGGLALGLRSWRWPLARRWVLILAMLTLTMAPVLLAGSIAGMAGLVFVAGLFLAPLIASSSQLLGRHAPQGMRTEAYSWGPTSIIVGAAVGTLLGGVLAEQHGWRVAVLACVLTGAIGTAVGNLRRRSLEVDRASISERRPALQS